MHKLSSSLGLSDGKADSSSTADSRAGIESGVESRLGLVGSGVRVDGFIVRERAADGATFLAERLAIVRIRTTRGDKCQFIPRRTSQRNRNA